MLATAWIPTSRCRMVIASRRGIAHPSQNCYMWTYRCYDDGKMPDLWRRRYDAHPDGQGSHDTVFHVLEQLVQWREPHTKILDKNADVIEVRLSGKDKIEYRILGFYGKTNEEFIGLANRYLIVSV